MVRLDRRQLLDQRIGFRDGGTMRRIYREWSRVAQHVQTLVGAAEAVDEIDAGL